MEKQNSKNRIKIIIMTSLVFVLMAFCTFIEKTTSWLYLVDSAKTTDGTNKIVSSNLEFYNNSTKIDGGTFTVAFGAAGTTTTLNVSVKNVSTAPVLLRVFYTFYIDQALKESLTTEHVAEGNLVIPNTWVEHQRLGNAYSGYLFYNSSLAVNGSARLFNTMIPTSAAATKTIKLHISAEAVITQGNAYTTGNTPLPWEDYPINWFATKNIGLQKAAASIITPRFTGLTWSQVGRIQMTAATSATTQNILICTHGGLWIGINSSTWQFQNFGSGGSGSADKTVAQFTTGQMVTVNFTINSTVTSNTYISLVWDATWSKQISFNNIKIWDKSDVLRFDIIPNGVNMYDRVSRTNMPMYNSGLSGATVVNTYYTYATI